MAKSKHKRTPKTVLKLPDLEQSKSAVMNSLTSACSKRSYDHAIREFIDWYCSEPRLAFNRTVVTRYRIALEQHPYAPSTINLRLAAIRRLAYEAYVVTDDSPLDLIAGQFDAGIHIGESIEKDMIAVKVSRDQRPAIVGAPNYFESHSIPKTPRDLRDHQCIGFRLGDTGIYRWEFEKNGEPLKVAVKGPVVLDDTHMVIQAALAGVGLAFAFEEHVANHMAK